MDDYRTRIKVLYSEIYNLCMEHNLNEEQLLQLFGEAERDILISNTDVKSTSVAMPSSAPNTTSTAVPSTTSVVIDEPLFNDNASGFATVNTGTQNVQPVGISATPSTSVSVQNNFSMIIDKPLFNDNVSNSSVVNIETQNAQPASVSVTPAVSTPSTEPTTVPLFNGVAVNPTVTQTASVATSNVMPIQNVNAIPPIPQSSTNNGV